MTTWIRGLRNAFRNRVRSVGIISILALSIGLSISMLLAYQAVGTKINDVKSSTGTTITVSPAGFFGGQGGGTALSSAKLASVRSLAHVTQVSESLTQRVDTAASSTSVSSTETSLSSPITQGSLGAQFGSGPPGSSSGTSSAQGSSSSTSTSATSSVTVVGTTTPGTALVGNGGSTETLVSGTTFSSTSDEDVAILGEGIAKKNNVHVGSTITMWGKSVEVVGIYNAGSTFANAEVLMPLATVQSLSNSVGDVTSATITVDSISHVTGVQSQVKAKLGSSADVVSSVETAESSLSPLNSVRTISLYALLAAVSVAAVITLLSMLMIVRERRREIGIVKAIGAQGQSVVKQFAVEASVLTGLGALMGLVIGILAANPITSSLVNNSSTSSTSTGGFARPGGGVLGGGGAGPGAGAHSGAAASGGPPGGFFGGIHSSLSGIQASVGWSTVAFGLLAAVVLAVVASSVATWSASTISPSEILRSE